MGLFRPPKQVTFEKDNLNRSRRTVERIVGQSISQEHWDEFKEFVAESIAEHYPHSSIIMQSYQILFIYAGIAFEDEEEIMSFVKKQQAKNAGFFSPNIESS
ncbi:MAG: hypothetical protein H8E26_00260 [FCB group bacterium]|nr:hypothetical protein [FCB group bacterium]